MRFSYNNEVAMMRAGPLPLLLYVNIEPDQDNEIDMPFVNADAIATIGRGPLFQADLEIAISDYQAVVGRFTLATPFQLRTLTPNEMAAKKEWDRWCLNTFRGTGSDA